MTELSKYRGEEMAVFDTSKVVTTLENLMVRVTESECTPETVNAACNAADKITSILRLHLEVQRLHVKTARQGRQ